MIFTFLASLIIAALPEAELLKKLEPISKIVTPALKSEIERELEIKVIDFSIEPSADEKEDFDFYSKYWEKRGRYRSAYPGLYFRKDEVVADLPSDRPFADRDLLIVTKEITREAYFHLLLHLLVDNSNRLDLNKKLEELHQKRKSAAEVDREAIERQIAEIQYAVFMDDVEAEKDLFLYSNAKTFDFTEADRKNILERLKEKTQKRLQGSFIKIELQSEKFSLDIKEAKEKMDTINSKIKEIEPKPENEADKSENK